MTSTVELKPGQPLYTLLELPSGGSGGVDEVRRLAALSVKDMDASGATVLGRKVDEWPTADLAKEIQKAFPIDPFTLIAKAWGQVRKLRKAIDASRGPPNSRQRTGLIRRSISQDKTPRRPPCYLLNLRRGFASTVSPCRS